MLSRQFSDDLADLARASERKRDAPLLRATTELFAMDAVHDRDEIRRYEELATHFLPKVTTGRPSIRRGEARGDCGRAGSGRPLPGAGHHRGRRTDPPKALRRLGRSICWPSSRRRVWSTIGCSPKRPSLVGRSHARAEADRRSGRAGGARCSGSARGAEHDARSPSTRRRAQISRFDVDGARSRRPVAFPRPRPSRRDCD